MRIRQMRFGGDAGAQEKEGSAILPTAVKTGKQGRETMFHLGAEKKCSSCNRFHDHMQLPTYDADRETCCLLPSTLFVLKATVASSAGCFWYVQVQPWHLLSVDSDL